jgi:hypothetical protein
VMCGLHVPSGLVGELEGNGVNMEKCVKLQ